MPYPLVHPTNVDLGCSRLVHKWPLPVYPFTGSGFFLAPVDDSQETSQA